MTFERIRNHPELSKETLVPVTKISEHIGRPVDRSTVEAWIRSGVRGIRLRTFLLGSRRFTTTEELTRWIEATNRAANEAANAERQEGCCHAE